MEILQRIPKILIIICLHIELIHAQAWTKADSLWLANMLSGKDTIRLNPEFQKAINSGTFINPGAGAPAGTMRMAPVPVPILKDFSEYIKKEEDSVKQGKVAWKDLPPSMFMRYFNAPPIDPLKRRDLNSFQVPGTVRNRGQAPSGMNINGLDFNGLLESVFSPSARERIKNRKREGTWKNYNNLPTPDIHRKQRKFRKDHPELMQTAVKKDSISNDSTSVIPSLQQTEQP